MPYGNITYPKSFNNNHRFTYFGLPLDNLYNELQFAFSINEQLLSSYNGNIIEVLEDDGGTTQEFKPSKTLSDEILAFVNGNNGYIVGIYDQKTGIKTSIPTSSQQIQIVNTGVLVDFTAKYLLEIPQNTLLTVSGIASCNRMKNLSLKSYIGFKGEKYINGYSNDYVFPINCTAGLMDFGITNGANVFWYTADGTISTSARPSPTLTNSGVSYLFASNFIANNIELKANNTGVRYVGNLKDLPQIAYYLDIYNCTQITGSLSDLQGKITYYLSLGNCNQITGSLSDLQGKITYLLNIYNCNQITGSLSDLQGKITYLLSIYNCNQITGSLSDLQGKLTYYLNIGNCNQITGSLSDLQGKLTYYLDIYNCNQITGSLSDLQGKLTYYLSIYNCNQITGSLSDLQGKITYLLNLGNCNQITGVYTPSNSTNTPTTFNIANTGLSASDVDNTLTTCHSLPKSGVTFIWTGLTRTSASDAVATELDTTYNWTFNPAL